MILAILPCLPTWCYLNRGYTQWFHWNALFYILTQNRTHASFLAMQGLTVTLGWYASLCYDWYAHGRFAHILYWNMPGSMTQYMMKDDQDEVMYDNATALAVMVVAHVLDTLGHPILAYYFWQKSSPSSTGKDNTSLSTSIWNRFSWTVLLSSYLLSRFWSALHTWYNHQDGKFALFYFGYDVYTVLDKEADLTWIWLPAYLMEAAVYAVFCLGKMWQTSLNPKTRTTTTMRPTSLDRVPSSLLSSIVSETDN